METNRLTLTGVVAEPEALRYTPAGVPLVSLHIRHESQQMEAGVVRRVNVEMAAVAIGEIAQGISALPGGSHISVEGFLARKSPQSNQIVLHICSLKTV
ncbi:primosomal replication protein N [Sulfuriferula multivorans]|uniref:Replication restart protein PriB n=1 Tax=Sulfuriferula multivorans TaxID=1559896 RepID=A0A401JEV0_9PROT|nr:primosomal replication protein N [Sulfuriferula multivorans]GBL46155.1 primosomal replication protein N [Sulfuriferula multivorans]